MVLCSFGLEVVLLGVVLFGGGLVLFYCECWCWLIVVLGFLVLVLVLGW